MGNLFTDLFSTKPAEEAAKAKAAGYTAGNTLLKTRSRRARRAPTRCMGRPMHHIPA
jgi:hypothetical protein